MAYQAIFKRYELKYLLTVQQKEQLLQVMTSHMALDEYGQTTIRNLYYDTDSFQLIRHSIERPAYKEKLRVRSYAKVNAQQSVFVELKKKYDSVVYKRRIALPQAQAMDWLADGGSHPEKSQIVNEIDYFREFYQTLRPVVFLSYDREAYYSLGGDDFRVTFDQNILSREQELSLSADIWGKPILEPEQVLMEIKTSGGMPLWMVHFLTEQHIYKTSFSKYGTAYTGQLFQPRPFLSSAEPKKSIITNPLGGQLYA